MQAIQGCTYYKIVNMTAEATLTYLTKHGIKPSVQRIAVMNYLLLHRTHPTADEIYHALLSELPTLSRTTVYNTLRVLVEQGAATQLTIDEHNVCYDADTSAHAHFLCTRCGRVFDIPLLSKHLQALADLPQGFTTDQSALYFRGCCAECVKQDVL